MPQGIILELVLLVLCVLAVVLGSVVLMQRSGALLPQRVEPLRGRQVPAASVAVAGRAGPAARADHARGRSGAARDSALRLLPAAAGDGAEGRLATAISSLYAIARSEDTAAAKIAERTLPRLQDYREPVESRLHLARHRLAVLSLGKEPQSARIATQCLAVLGGQ